VELSIEHNYKQALTTVLNERTLINTIKANFI